MTLEQQVCPRKPWNKGKQGYHMPLRGGGYQAIHKWLKKHHGKADRCENQECNKKSNTFVWAKIHGKEYTHERSNFWMLCLSCHTTYDMTDDWKKKLEIKGLQRRHTEVVKTKISNSSKGRIFTEEHRRNLSLSKIGNKYAARKSGS